VPQTKFYSICWVEFSNQYTHAANKFHLLWYLNYKVLMHKTKVLTSIWCPVGMSSFVVLYVKLVGCLFDCFTHTKCHSRQIVKEIFQQGWKEHPVVSCDSVLVYMHSTIQYYRNMGNMMQKSIWHLSLLDLTLGAKNNQYSLVLLWVPNRKTQVLELSAEDACELFYVRR
jgi:hypothetical protein